MQLSVERVEVEVYFLRWDTVANSARLVSRPRLVARGELAIQIKAALETLIDGPTEEESNRGISTEIPPDARVNNVKVKGNIAYVDLSHELASGGGSFSMTARLYQIVYTVTSFPDVLFIQVLLQGEKREALGGEGLIINQPISRPAFEPVF